MLKEILKWFNTDNSFINNGIQRSTHPQQFFVLSVTFSHPGILKRV